MEYVINGMHMFELDIVADVVPVSLDPSEEHFNFAFGSDNWDTYVDQSVLLDNPHSFDAEFELKTTNPVFSASIPEGVVSVLAAAASRHPPPPPLLTLAHTIQCCDAAHGPLAPPSRAGQHD